jgi:hypothetical protein
MTVRDTEAASRAFMDCPDGIEDSLIRRKEIGEVEKGYTLG